MFFVSENPVSLMFVLSSLQPHHVHNILAFLWGKNNLFNDTNIKFHLIFYMW